MAGVDPMESIFHEKQEGSLCAQHCLNALLQGSYFTAVDLADIARQLDESERQHMAEAGTQSAEYRRFIQQPSSNFDDSGFFSIQVLQKALSVWNVELRPFTSSDPIAKKARDTPKSQVAYICNFREHWFSVRKLGIQWFNLNSLLIYPELISDTYLSLFLTQLQQEGYSIFLTVGSLPACDADAILKVVPAVQTIKPALISDTPKSGSRSRDSGRFADKDLQRALDESKRLNEQGDTSLKQALERSMEGLPDDFLFNAGAISVPTSHRLQPEPGPSQPAEPPPSPQELREKRLAFFNKPPAGSGIDPEGPVEGSTSQTAEDHRVQPSAPHSGDPPTSQSEGQKELSEEEMLQLALHMSMEGT